MERSKVRPTDNLRCFFLARFLVEYLLLLRSKSEAKNGGTVPEEDQLQLGLVGEIAELESVKWVVMRMKYTMDDKVRCCRPSCQSDELIKQPPSWKELQA
jgi:replication fork protection complex subunit Tof1/Swi1